MRWSNCLSCSKSLEVVETKNDDQGRILILDIKIFDKELLLVNLYNANTEKEQLDTLTKVSEMLKSIPNIINKNLILGDDFSLFFNTSLETQDGNPILKKTSSAKLIEIKETLYLCDIWRTSNLKSKRFTFHQNHVFCRIHRRLDYFVISIFLQETVIRADVLASFCSDYSPIIYTFWFESNNKRGKGMWEFNKSLLSNDEYTNKLKNHISEFLIILDQNGVKDYQSRWEYIKFEIRQF